MKRINRKDIAIEKWDALVQRTPSASIFDTSTYLDAVAENWCILVDEAYTKGIALPYTKRLGVEALYTPIFLRNVTFLGELESLEVLKNLLQQTFKLGQLSISLESEQRNFYYQTLPIDAEQVYSNLGKRMLKRFEKNKFTFEFSLEQDLVEYHINNELADKINAINAHTLKALNRLVMQFKQQQKVHIVNVLKAGKSVGGLFLLESNHRLLYLKGAFTEESKKEGAMYGAMQRAIDLAKEKGLLFDFGGSRVEGVRRFNVNLGGKDSFYSSIEWNNAPFWFNWLKKLQGIWKKR